MARNIKDSLYLRGLIENTQIHSKAGHQAKLGSEQSMNQMIKEFREKA
jgi:hypothetical protein